jgi:DNA-binding transcriptional LysR family regulator
MDRLTSLEVFCAVVDQGGFTRAAEHLSMSPAMVSTHLSRLEERLGVQLLIRTTRRLGLTQRGRQFLEEARHILSALAAAEAAASGGGLPSGRVRIDTPASLGINFLIPAIPEFRRQYPQIIIDLTLGDRGVIFRPDGFDIVIRVGEMPHSEGVVQKLGQTRLVQVASPAYLAAHPAPHTPEELAAHDGIIYASTQAQADKSWRLSAHGETRWLHPREAVTLNDGEALRDAALGGAGIAQTLEILVARELAEGRLVRVMPEWNQEPLPIYQLSPADRHERAAVQAARRFLAEAIDWCPHKLG